MKNTIEPTPTTGYKWPTNKKRMYVRVPVISRYKKIFKEAAKAWTDSTNMEITVHFVAETNEHFLGGLVDKSSESWAGYCWYSARSNNHLYWASMVLNKYYTDNLTDQRNIAIAAHEIGHGIGLDHAKQTDQSVMTPSIHKYLTPQPMDIMAVNSLYQALVKSQDEYISEGQKLSGIIEFNALWAKSYNNLSELFTEADVVISGKVISEGEAYFLNKDDISSYVTRTEVVIKQLFKGYTKGDIKNTKIYIRQLGGNFDDIIVKSHQTTLLQKNEEVILFLKEGTDNMYYLINENESLLVKQKDFYQHLSTGQMYNENQLNKIVITDN